MLQLLEEILSKCGYLDPKTHKVFLQTFLVLQREPDFIHKVIKTSSLFPWLLMVKLFI